MQFDIQPQELDIIAKALGKIPLEESLGVYNRLLLQYREQVKAQSVPPTPEAKGAKKGKPLEKVVPANGV